MPPLLSIGYSVKTRRQSPWTPSFGQSIKVTAPVLPLAERPMPLAIARQRRRFNRRRVGRSAVDRQSAAGRCGRSELSRLAVNWERRADHVRPCWGLTSRVNAGVTTHDRTGLERRMKALEPNFAELDGVIVQVERVIHLFRKCGVEDLVAMVRQGLAAGITWRRRAALLYGRRAAGRRRSVLSAPCRHPEGRGHHRSPMEAHLMFGWELHCLPFKACKVRPASSSIPMAASRCLGGRARDAPSLRRNSLVLSNRDY